MSMSTHIVGFRAVDEKWNQMKAAYLACEAAGIWIPEEVVRFFGYNHPSNLPGLEVDISHCVDDYDDDCRNGFELDITKLPPDVKIIRFYNSH